MEPVKERLETMHQALALLKRSIELYRKHDDLFKKDPSADNKDYFMGMRESMIQRFEYNFDLFWKLLKVYLADVEKIVLDAPTPTSVVRACVQYGILSEQEGNNAMSMRDGRNMTSHIYREEVAMFEAQKIPDYYIFIHTVTNRLKVD